MPPSGDSRPRPMGGRPLPPTPEPTRPLEIRRPKTPLLKLQLPDPEPPRRAPTPKISVQIPVVNGRAAPLSDATDMMSTHTIGPALNGHSDSHSDPSITVRPPLSSGTDFEHKDDYEKLRKQISELSVRKARESESEDDEETVSRRFKGDHWTDDDFKVLARLGEGAGGAVFKVEEKRSGTIMARKTIPTHATPGIQLIRELSFMSVEHPHIIEYMGAYISSSSSEVNVLMELGEGGSLDAVAKKVRELGKRISEPVIAQLALGVRLCFTLLVSYINVPSRYSGDLTTSIAGGLFIETLNHQISSLPETVLSNSVISEYQVN